MIIKSSLGLSFGVVFSVLLFKRRAWPAWVGLGFGAGRAWEEADGMFTSAIALDLLQHGLLGEPISGHDGAEWTIQLP
jgi:inner membrane organizing system protein 1